MKRRLAMCAGSELRTSNDDLSLIAARASAPPFRFVRRDRALLPELPVCLVGLGLGCTGRDRSFFRLQHRIIAC